MGLNLALRKIYIYQWFIKYLIDSGSIMSPIFFLKYAPKPIQSISRDVREEAKSYNIYFFQSLFTPIYKGPRSKLFITKRFLTDKL